MKMNNKRNILFVCKHNLFRSKVAEAYFNKINKNKDFVASSAGIIRGDFLNKTQKKSISLQRSIAHILGLNLNDKFTGLSISLLKKQDLVIIVADDVPKLIFDNKEYVKKVKQWKIKDYGLYNTSLVMNVIKQIMVNVEKLVNEIK